MNSRDSSGPLSPAAARLACLALLLVALPAGPSGAASVFAEVEQDGVVISDEAGNASMGLMDDAVVVVYLDLAPDEQASVFEADFDLFSQELDVDTQISVDCDVSESAWPAGAECNVVGGETTTTYVAVSLTSENDGTDRVIVEILLSSLGVAGLLDVLLQDAVLYYDTDEEPFFVEFFPDEPDGTVLSSILVPEPGAVGSSMSLLLSLALLRRRRIRQGM